MKRKLHSVIVVTLFFISAAAMAQTSGGPDGFGYVWRNNADVAGPVYQWIDISTRPGVVTVQGLQDDNIKGPFSLSIPFVYYWYQPNKFWIGSNGYIGFSSATAAHPFPLIPLLTGPNDWMAIMASDLTFTDANTDTIPGAHCQYWQGTDSLIITWENVPFWDDPSTTVVGYSGLNTFQLILSAADSSITYQYKAQIGTYNPNPIDFMEIGIENNSGSMGLEVGHDQYPTNAMAIKFYYPDTVTVAISDASTTYVEAPGSKGQILSKGITSYTSKASVKNTGNQPLASFNSYSRVLNASNVIQVRDTLPVNALAPGASQFLTYPDTWTPAATGVFRQVNQTLLTGDATPSNNTDTCELWVIDEAAPIISLQWDGGISSGASIGWLGGGGGVAQHFTPSFYPAVITAVGALVVSDISAVGFSLQVYADDGIGGAPGTLLDSIFVFPGSFPTGIYYEIPTDSNITISTNGFYVAYMMGGPDIQLGQDASTPHAHQAFEILGPAGNPANWSVYRDQFNDPIIHAVILGNPSTGQNELVSNPNRFGIFYPNPANQKTALQYKLNGSAEVKYALYTLEGRLVDEKNIGRVTGGTDETLELNLRNYPAGLYVCKITAGENEYHRKISIIR
jgi:hypothetical protein